jgi:hypothetical protein
MATRPTHIAYTVQEPREGSDAKATWREVGALWPTKNGFTLQIHDQFAISGRIVITERKDREEPAERPTQGQRSTNRSGPAPRG